MSQQHTVFAGVDIGHSAVKMTFDGASGVERVYFPSVVAPALAIIDEAEAERARAETVYVGDKSYWVGDTARIQGGISCSSGLLDDWVRMDQHKALVSQACRLVREASGNSPVFLATGLPVSLFNIQKMEIRRQFAELLPPGSQVAVVPQPMAGYYHATIMRDGSINPARSISQDSYAIIDIGYYTSDFVLIREGRWVQSGASSAPGVRVAVDVFMDAMKRQGIDCDLQRAEEALSTGRLRSARHPEQQQFVLESIGKAFAVMADSVYDEFHRIMGKQASILDGIFIIGGAAERILDRIRSEWRVAEVPVDDHRQPANSVMARMGLRAPTLSGPRFVVSEGLYRLVRSNYVLMSKA